MSVIVSTMVWIGELIFIPSLMFLILGMVLIPIIKMLTKKNVK